jgi:hypothetical protein
MRRRPSCSADDLFKRDIADWRMLDSSSFPSISSERFFWQNREVVLQPDLPCPNHTEMKRKLDEPASA